jgi:hypothetical protein
MTEPVELADQPLNVYPVRVGADAALEIEAPVFTDPAVTAEPPCESYVIVRAFAAQIAYRVKFAVWPCVYGNVRTLPVSVTDHPLNVYPALVGAVGADAMLAPVFTDPLVTALPPFES